MKKLTITLLGAAVLAGGLFADTMKGQMNHSNMQEMCKQFNMKQSKAYTQDKGIQKLNKVKEIFSSDGFGA